MVRRRTIPAIPMAAKPSASNALAVAAALPFAGPGAAALAQVTAVAGAPGLSLDLSGALAATVEASDPVDRSQADSESWWGELNLTLWLPGISGTIGAAGVSTSVNLSFTDILNDTSTVFGVAGGLTVGKDAVGVSVDGYWSRMTGDAVTAMGTINLATTMGIFDFGIVYRILRQPVQWTASAGKPARDAVILAYLGGRYTTVDSTLTLTGFPSVSGSQGWVDPMIGVRGTLPLGRHVSLAFRGDIGGFGASSDLAWTAAAGVSWDFDLGSLPASLQLGYLAIGDSYHSGSGATRFTWNTIVHGLVLNFGLRF